MLKRVIPLEGTDFQELNAAVGAVKDATDKLDRLKERLISKHVDKNQTEYPWMVTIDGCFILISRYD